MLRFVSVFLILADNLSLCPCSSVTTSNFFVACLTNSVVSFVSFFWFWKTLDSMATVSLCIVFSHSNFFFFLEVFLACKHMMLIS